MIMIWIIGAVMIAAALALILPPLLRSKTGSAKENERLNLLLYEGRLKELEDELANGIVSQDKFEAAQGELKRNLLQDLDGAADTAAKTSGLSRWGATIVVVLVLPSLLLGLYARLGGGDMALNPKPPAVANQQEPPDLASIEEMVAGLAAKLQANPDNAEGWYMLARSYIFLERFQEAALAFSRVHELKGNQPELLADYAEVLALANDNNAIGRPAELAAQALQQQPDNPKALWLLGIAAFQQNDHTQALTYWERLLPLLPPQGETTDAVHSFIQQARAQTNSVAPTTTPEANTQDAVVSALDVQITLADNLKTQTNPEDIVLVYARALQGPRMPLAIVRKQVKDLPLQVRLDDSMSMMAGMNLSSVPQVQVLARVTKTGNAMPQSGDLQGKSEPIATGSIGKVALTINAVVP